MELAAGNREYGSTYGKSLGVLAQIRFFPPFLWFLGFLPGNISSSSELGKESEGNKKKGAEQ